LLRYLLLALGGYFLSPVAQLIILNKQGKKSTLVGVRAAKEKVLLAIMQLSWLKKQRESLRAPNKLKLNDRPFASCVCIFVLCFIARRT